MKKQISPMSLILLGGVFITSEHFMNVENDVKAYFIGVLLILLLLVYSISRKGLSVDSNSKIPHQNH